MQQADGVKLAGRQFELVAIDGRTMSGRLAIGGAAAGGGGGAAAATKRGGMIVARAKGSLVVGACARARPCVCVLIH